MDFAYLHICVCVDICKHMHFVIHNKRENVDGMTQEEAMKMVHCEKFKLGKKMKSTVGLGWEVHTGK